MRVLHFSHSPATAVPLALRLLAYFHHRGTNPCVWPHVVFMKMKYDNEEWAGYNALEQALGNNVAFAAKGKFAVDYTCFSEGTVVVLLDALLL